MFNSVLIANRGEIACRVARTAKRLGLRAIAVYSTADANALHRRVCDEAHWIGEAPPRDSYLSIERLIEVAKRSAAQCIHPGYGFLSENADFAEACDRAGIVFVGPPAAAIRTMGLKDSAKALMEQAGVPIVPGYHGERQDTKFLKEKAYEIGYPVLIKPAAGGGGRGMRLVEKHADFAPALEGAIRESQSAFGSEPGVDREIYSLAAPHRGPGFRRPLWQHDPSRRTRLLAAAPSSEGRRGSTGARHDRGFAGTDRRGRSRGRQGGRL
jgi:3-methylcrotonyl-CoA carboxylase alpha subunit